MTRRYEFGMALSAQKTREIYRGRARYILVETDDGTRLQLPASRFREFVDGDGIHGRFRVETDTEHKLQSLQRI